MELEKMARQLGAAIQQDGLILILKKQDLQMRLTRSSTTLWAK